jgi:hypothetical protein
MKKSVMLVLLAFLFFKCDNKQQTNSLGVESYIDTIFYVTSSPYTEFIQHVAIKASIVNKSSDTLLLITSKKDYVTYSNDFFKISNESDDREKGSLRSSVFMPIETDPGYYLLNPSDPVNREVIILPHETRKFGLYRAYYNINSKSDSIEFLNYLRGVKIRYTNNLNNDSLKIKFPNYTIVRELLMELKK